jgi:DNA polymerase-3 subunit delta'
MTTPSNSPEISAPLPWQAQAWSRLNQQLGEEQLPHALLLTGPQYTGKTRLALALARLLLCASPAGGLNCGRCHSCELSASGNNGDFQWLEPEGKSRVIKIEQVRKVVEFTGKTASFGLRKIVVIAPAENMNISAANALLKVLEEPAPNTYLVLVCHRPHGLPATIRSRCQIVRPAFPSRAQSLEWLDRMCSTRAESERLLDLAGERPLLAAQLHEEASGERMQLVRLAMERVFAGESGSAALAAALAGVDLPAALGQLLGGIQALLRSQDGAALASARARAAFRLLDEIMGIQRAVNGGSNPNPQLLLDALLAKVQRLLGDGGLGDNIRANHEGAHP